MAVYILIEPDMSGQDFLDVYSSPDTAKDAASNYYEDEDLFSYSSWIDGDDGSETGIYIGLRKVDYMFD